MPQEFQVLQCFSCKTFQVHQVKKALKWSCKMCGEKQSIIKVYGQGTGVECRQHVQKLNSLRGEIDDIRGQVQSPSGVQSQDTACGQINTATDYPVTSSHAKWDQFVEVTNNDDQDDYNDDRVDHMYTTDAAVFRNVKRAQKRKSGIDQSSSRKAERWDCGKDAADDRPPSSSSYCKPVKLQNNYSNQSGMFGEQLPSVTNPTDDGIYSGDNYYKYEEEQVLTENRNFGRNANYSHTQTNTVKDKKVEKIETKSSATSKWNTFVPSEPSSEEFEEMEGDNFANMLSSGCNTSASISTLTEDVGFKDGSPIHESKYSEDLKLNNLKKNNTNTTKPSDVDGITKADSSQSKWGRFVENSKVNIIVDKHGEKNYDNEMKNTRQQTSTYKPASIDDLKGKENRSVANPIQNMFEVTDFDNDDWEL